MHCRIFKPSSWHPETWPSGSPVIFVHAAGNLDSGIFSIVKVKGKIFYGQEPSSGESTTTECGVNYKLLAVIY